MRALRSQASSKRIATVHAWSVGDHLTHRFNAELGTGRVTAIEGRVLVVHFPHSGATLRLAANSDALVPAGGDAARRDRSLLERLAAGDIDDTEDFLTRLDILHLLATREAERPRIVPRRAGPAVPASTARRRARDRAAAGALAARRRSRPGQDHRSRADHEPAAAHPADRALPGRRARGADGAVAGRVVAQVPPGVHAARSRRAWPTSSTTSAPASTRSTSIAAR